MANKKSYMNKENVLSEGFFSKLSSILGLSSKETKALKKDRTFMSSLKDLNKSQRSLEKQLSKIAGKKIKLSKYSLKDFLG